MSYNAPLFEGEAYSVGLAGLEARSTQASQARHHHSGHVTLGGISTQSRLYSNFCSLSTPATQLSVDDSLFLSFFQLLVLRYVFITINRNVSLLPPRRSNAEAKPLLSMPPNYLHKLCKPAKTEEQLQTVEKMAVNGRSSTTCQSQDYWNCGPDISVDVTRDC